ISQLNKIIIKIEKIKYTVDKETLKNIVEISRKKVRKLMLSMKLLELLEAKIDFTVSGVLIMLEISGQNTCMRGRNRKPYEMLFRIQFPSFTALASYLLPIGTVYKFSAPSDFD
ncbi:unnamed protein product, partial [Heterotrigona itama]